MEEHQINLHQQIDVSSFKNQYTVRNKVGRLLWYIVWLLLYRPSPRIFFIWRRFLLRCFGARIGAGVHVYPTAKIWAPWNLEMGDHSCLGGDVDCYCADRITVGAHATVSQYSYLCAAGHDISDPHMKLVTAPIRIGAGVWICARAFVGPGVTVGDGAVLAACAVVVRDVEPWTVVGGNPAKVLKKRELRNAL